MKRYTIIGILFLSLIAMPSGAQDWQWKDINGGMQYAYSQFEMFSSTQSVSVLRYRAGHFRTEVVSDPGLEDWRKEPASTTSGLAARHDAVAAINGSYFNMTTLYPTTFVKDEWVREGETRQSEAFRADGIVAMKRHRVDIFRCQPEEYGSEVGGYKEALSSGPVLIQDGVTRTEWPASSFYTGRHPRTVIGTDGHGWVYMIVIDGRFPGQADGCTIAETAAIAELFGLTDALNLDGGGSSCLWINGVGVISHPYDNHRFDHEGERVIPNAIIVK